MAFDLGKAEAFWASVEIDERVVEKIYAMIVNGVDKADVLLEGDEEKVWDFVAMSVEENPCPEGSTYEIPSWN